VLENGVLRNMFGPREKSERWLEKTCVLNSTMMCSPHQILSRVSKSRKSCLVYVARVGQKKNHTRLHGGNFKGKTPLGMARHTWEDDIKIDLREVEPQGVDSNDLAQKKDR
jgi:hypothetical protein